MRTVHGLATGDLNLDGFVDVVTASNFNILQNLTKTVLDLGSPFESTALFVDVFQPVTPIVNLPFETQLNPDLVRFDFPDGTLSVDINSGDNGNRWTQVTLLGMKGRHPDAKVNRDGIGAVITFTPHRDLPVLKPVLGGSSYASQNSLNAHFGLGRRRAGVVDVLWPGGVKNRFDSLTSGQRLRFPEIPYSYDDPNLSLSKYKSLVRAYMKRLVRQGIIPNHLQSRFINSQVKAFKDFHRN